MTQVGLEELLAKGGGGARLPRKGLRGTLSMWQSCMLTPTHSGGVSLAPYSQET